MLMTLPIFISDGLNISSLKSNPQVPDNRTIQKFVKDYVDEFVGGCFVAIHAPVLFASFIVVYYYFLMLIPLTHLTIFLSGDLNISSSQTQPQLPDNNTIQSFLEAYVDDYMGGYTVRYQRMLLCLN